MRRDAVEAAMNPDEAFVVANGASGLANNLGEDFVEAAAVAVLA